MLTAVSSLRPHTVGVLLLGEELTSLEVVALHGAARTSEILDTVTRGLPGGRAGDLPGQHVELLGRGGAGVRDGHTHSVRVARPELSVHWGVRGRRLIS